MAFSVTAKCPVCDGSVEIDTPVLGIEVDYPDCEKGLLVTSLTPLTLAYALDADDAGWFEDERR